MFVLASSQILLSNARESYTSILKQYGENVSKVTTTKRQAWKMPQAAN